jgi:hypothetical protein
MSVELPSFINPAINTLYLIRMGASVLRVAKKDKPRPVTPRALTDESLYLRSLYSSAPVGLETRVEPTPRRKSIQGTRQEPAFIRGARREPCEIKGTPNY